MKEKNRIWNIFIAVIMLAGLLYAGGGPKTVQAASTSIVISQVYGGGGNSGATYKNDFIELYNLGSTPVDVTGWSVQYASSSGSTWYKTVLSGTIQPGNYYLVQESQGSGGTVNLPTPDATGTIYMSGTNGKVALDDDSTTLTGTCPTDLIDFVGYGSANCSETAPTPALSNTTAALRKGNGSVDTDDNLNDFTIGDPFPRNSSYPFSATGLATPAGVVEGQTTLLTVAVTPGVSPASTGITVTCDLSPIGGSASQSLYDDGTNGDVTSGDNTFSFITLDTTPGPQDVTCTFSDDQARSGSTTITVTLLEIIPIGEVNGAVGDTDDGTTHRSPYAPPSGNYAGTTIVTVQGVVYEKTLQATAYGTQSYGIFIQNTAATADGDPNTSDGLFVYMGSYNDIKISTGDYYVPNVGDELVLSGRVSEYYNMTELSSSLEIVEVARTGVDIESEIPPVVVDPPANLDDANRYWERMQGMRVQVPAGSTVLGGRNVFSPSDGEVWVAAPDSTIAQRTEPYTNRAFRDANPLDDNYDPNNWDGNGYRILMGSLGIKGSEDNDQALIAPANTFQTVTNAPAGGLNYTYSKYRIEITEQPVLDGTIDPAANNPPEAFDRSTGYSIVDYNLENLYDYRNNPNSGCDFQTDTGCSNEGTPFLSPVDPNPTFNYVPSSDAAYQARLTDIALQIINDLHSPDILMVQEVENQDICSTNTPGGVVTCDYSPSYTGDGRPDALQDLAYKIKSLGGPAYDSAFDPDSSDLRGIVPAYMFRSDRVELLPAAGDPVLGEDPTIDYAGAGVPANAEVSNPKTLNAVLPEGISACETSWVFPRAVDIGLFRIFTEGIDSGAYRDVYILNNHFKSGPDSCVAHRTEQAKYNAAVVKYIEENVPNARIIVGGDLNVYPRPDDPIAPPGTPEDQLGALYDPSLGLTNAWDLLEARSPESAYSYVYIGMAQTLDQMFFNKTLLKDLQQFNIAHINSDFPADYPADVARGTSDHDPNFAVLDFYIHYYFPRVSIP